MTSMALLGMIEARSEKWSRMYMAWLYIHRITLIELLLCVQDLFGRFLERRLSCDATMEPFPREPPAADTMLYLSDASKYHHCSKEVRVTTVAGLSVMTITTALGLKSCRSDERFGFSLSLSLST